MTVGVVQRITGVVNILQNQHMAALDIRGDIPLDFHLSGGIGSGIGGDPHKIHLAVGFDFPDHVRIKHYNALEDANDDGILPRVVRRQLFAQLRDAGLDLFLGQQNLLNVLFHSFFSLMLCFSFYLHA